MQCPICGANVNDESKFCPKCGRKIPRCPTCGEVIRSRIKFCSKDGTALPAEILALFPDASAPPRPVSPPPQEKKNNGNLVVILIAAGAVLLILLLIAAGYAVLTGSLPFGGDKDTEVTARKPVKQDYWVQSEDDHVPEAVAPSTRPTEPPETVAPETQPPTEAPTEAPTEPVRSTDAMLLEFLEYCDSEFFTEADIEGFDAEQSRLARNGIYAKSGRKFKDAALQDYYEQFDWYEPKVDPANFSGDMLNKYQKANLNLISTYESDHGYR